MISGLHDLRELTQNDKKCSSLHENSSYSLANACSLNNMLMLSMKIVPNLPWSCANARCVAIYSWLNNVCSLYCNVFHERWNNNFNSVQQNHLFCYFTFKLSGVLSYWPFFINVVRQSKWTLNSGIQQTDKSAHLPWHSFRWIAMVERYCLNKSTLFMNKL